MISVLIVGNGNVASHLLNAFSSSKNVNVTQIGSRNLNEVPSADVTIIAVSDDAIAEVSSKINNNFIVHTSGSISMNSLRNNTRKGVFYMLQTFTKDKKVNFSNVPFCIEAETESDLHLLETLSKVIGKHIYKINSNQRKAIHVAAVFANNFTNHMYKLASDICIDNNVPFEILQPLINETSEKIKSLSPKKAQTGPAVRGDKTTIKNHLNLLNNHQQSIYKILTNSIQNGDKL